MIFYSIFFRVQPSYLKLKEEMLSGAIGEVFDVNSQFGVQIEADRVAKKELGGGALLDIGIYCVQFSQFIFEVGILFGIFKHIFFCIYSKCLLR